MKDSTTKITFESKSATITRTGENGAMLTLPEPTERVAGDYCCLIGRPSHVTITGLKLTEEGKRLFAEASEATEEQREIEAKRIFRGTKE